MIVAIIPARYGSTRFPGKSLALICGKPMVQWVCEAVLKSETVEEVYVATDDQRIFEASIVDSILFQEEYATGTDRVAEAARLLLLKPDDIVLNVQGDEPLIRPEAIDLLVERFREAKEPMATLYHMGESIKSRVVLGLSPEGRAVDFSREASFYHIGVYAFRNEFLQTFSRLSQSENEKTFRLEQYRALDNGYPILAVPCPWDTVAVDYPEDIRRVEEVLCSQTGLQRK